MQLTIADSTPALDAATAAWRSANLRVGFVPTMGALHAGHVSLVREARRHADRVVVSVFVNPTQFGPGEDFTRYPRTFEQDCAALDGLADLVFAPSVDDLYPNGPVSDITAGAPAHAGLEDAFRPGHFDGVATVVARLLRIVRPDVAVFGEKDYQQLLVVKDMARSHSLPVKIIGAPTVRELDGLAMSSRNRYLAPAERSAAATIHATLREMARSIRDGQPIAASRTIALAALEAAGFAVDYLEARRADDLGRPDDSRAEGLRLLVAARIGATRLIDNIEV